MGAKLGDNVRIVCVQSVKGGVGKTMLSFLLAQHLRGLDSANRVMVFDLDFTGTSVADMVPSGDDGIATIHGVRVRPMRGPKRNRVCTLLDLFQHHLGGHDLSETLDYCNFSATDAVSHLASGTTYGPRKDPSAANVLFDANHALWFVDFLFDLFGYLNKKLAPEPSAPFYIILDNAPGQSELLPLLQERLLRWGTHRAKFLQVATLDEMDIRASLEVLAQIQQRAATIHQTKKVIAEHGPNASSSDWGRLLAGHRWDGIDRELLLELLTDSPDAIKTACEEYRLEEQHPRFAALILNRVFETLDLGRVDEFILERVGKPDASLLDIPRIAFPFDPALALFFQERFRAAPPKDSKPATAPAPESSPPEPPAASPDAPKEKPENRLRRLAELDLALYRKLYSRKAWHDFGATQRTLARAFTVSTASHLYRGLDVFARLFDLSHRILRACHPDLPQPAPDGLSFRARMLNNLVVRMEEEAEKESTTLNPWDDVQGASFLNACTPVGKKANGPNFVEALENFKKSHAIDRSDRIAHQMAAGLFPTFGVFISLPDQIEPKSGTLKPEFAPFFKELYTVAGMALKEALNRESAQALCEDLHNRFSSHPNHRAEQVQKFNLELGDIMERLRLFETSVEHGETSSNMLLTLLKQLPADGNPLTELAELYLHTALAGLFQGLRTDHKQVRIEVLKLLAQGSGDAPQDLAARIEQRLGNVTDHLFAAGAGHADP
ncbi:MAG: P-loop NTPase [Candidatus Contendobacter sp.]|nr:P-loop NTPase [Candidatus Contendobacter sp.]